MTNVITPDTQAFNDAVNAVAAKFRTLTGKDRYNFASAVTRKIINSGATVSKQQEPVLREAIKYVHNLALSQIDTATNFHTDVPIFVPNLVEKLHTLAVEGCIDDTDAELLAAAASRQAGRDAASLLAEVADRLGVHRDNILAEIDRLQANQDRWS